jgi:hypothetical protein
MTHDRELAIFSLDPSAAQNSQTHPTTIAKHTIAVLEGRYSGLRIRLCAATPLPGRSEAAWSHARAGGEHVPANPQRVHVTRRYAG